MRSTISCQKREVPDGPRIPAVSSQGIRVLLLTRYSRMGASSRLRALQYIPYLSAHGCDITVHSLLDDDYINRLNAGTVPKFGRVAAAFAARSAQLIFRRPWDLIWIEREMFPWLPGSFELTWLRRSNVPYVLELDDAVFLRYSENNSRIVR